MLTFHFEISSETLIYLHCIRKCILAPLCMLLCVQFIASFTLQIFCYLLNY